MRDRPEFAAADGRVLIYLLFVPLLDGYDSATGRRSWQYGGVWSGGEVEL